MVKCPACDASTKGDPTCGRCKMDLSTLIALENSAQTHLQKARNAFECGNFSGMLFNAGRAFSLKKSNPATRLFALAALINKDFHLAGALRDYEKQKDESLAE